MFNQYPKNYAADTPVELVAIEDATVTTATESSTQTVRCVNIYLINDGADDITFSVYPKTASDTAVEFTLKAQEIVTKPFQFLKLSWAAVTTTSAFRCLAYKA